MAVIDRAADSPAVSAGVERAIRQGPEWFSRLEPFWTTVIVGQNIRSDLYRYHRREAVRLFRAGSGPGRSW